MVIGDFWKFCGFSRRPVIDPSVEEIHFLDPIFDNHDKQPQHPAAGATVGWRLHASSWVVVGRRFKASQICASVVVVAFWLIASQTFAS